MLAMCYKVYLNGTWHSGCNGTTFSYIGEMRRNLLSTMVAFVKPHLWFYVKCSAQEHHSASVYSVNLCMLNFHQVLFCCVKPVRSRYVLMYIQLMHVQNKFVLMYIPYLNKRIQSKQIYDCSIHYSKPTLWFYIITLRLLEAFVSFVDLLIQSMIYLM